MDKIREELDKEVISLHEQMEEEFRKLKMKVFQIGMHPLDYSTAMMLDLVITTYKYWPEDKDLDYKTYLESLLKEIIRCVEKLSGKKSNGKRFFKTKTKNV